MTLESMLAATGVPRLFGRGDDRSYSNASQVPTSSSVIGSDGETYRVMWDEVAPGQAGSWPAGGAFLFLWPHLSGDLRRPPWMSRASDPEDENAAWWNREDSKVSAALLRPFYADLVAFLSERAGPASFEFLSQLEAKGQHPRRFDTGQRLRAISDSFLVRSSPLERLAALVEGAEEGDRAACTVTFGTRKTAFLHARRDERCLWLWLAPGIRDGFDRFREEASGGANFLRCDMDWSMTGIGLPAPRPPEAFRR